MASDDRKTLVCAIYTRKSSEEGLEQEFNSLHAQREACEAYISSQRHEGWRVSSAHYDDGGFSGGNMERPALLQLMDDIRSRRVDIVVVYKVDRLTRSLSDFAKIVEVFDGQGVSFVSVTQQFNTTTSMGRLTLNVLLSFAQFEREVTGERIRDKIAASKKKGMFMGGGVPLGYDLEDHKLIVNKEEADAVRAIFHLYVELRSVCGLQTEIELLGIRTKVRKGSDGRKRGGTPFGRGHLYYLLRNRTYRGEIFHKGEVYPGQHEAIIDELLWDKVQEILASNARERSVARRSQSSSPLTGILFDELGNRMTPVHTQKGTARYRYYICQAIAQGRQDKVSALRRIPAVEIEAVVAKQVIDLLTKPAALIDHLFGPEATAREKQSVVTSANMLAKTLGQNNELKALLVVRDVLLKVVAGAERLALVLDGKALRAMLKLKEPESDARSTQFTISVPIIVARSGRQKCVVIGNDNGGEPLVNKSMIKAVARAIKWDQEIRAGISLRHIAKREGLSASYVTRIMPLAFLAPDIVQAIFEGRQPLGLKVKALSANLPLAWVDQRLALGFAAR